MRRKDGELDKLVPKRDLLLKEKRPIIEGKETYYWIKRTYY